MILIGFINTFIPLLFVFSVCPESSQSE